MTELEMVIASKTDTNLKYQLYKKYLPLIKRCYTHFYKVNNNHYMTLEDYMSEAYIIMDTALRRFDASRITNTTTWLFMSYFEKALHWKNTSIKKEVSLYSFPESTKESNNSDSILDLMNHTSQDYTHNKAIQSIAIERFEKSLSSREKEIYDWYVKLTNNKVFTTDKVVGQYMNMTKQGINNHMRKMKKKWNKCMEEV